MKLLVDCLNFDFKGKYRPLSKKGIPSTWLRWFIGMGFDSPEGWKKADRVQRRIVAALFVRNPKTGDRDIEQLVADANRHVEKVFWEVDREDVRRIRMLPVLSKSPEAYLYICILRAIDNEDFWLLARCRYCQRFFASKENFCGAACRRNHNNSTSKERVRKARATKRFREIFPKLLRLQKIAKSKSFTEMLDAFPGLDPKLLAGIKEDKPFKDLEVKYKNRRMLLALKI